MSRLHLRRLFLFLMLGSLALAAALGVGIFMFEVRMNDRTIQVILTAIAVALFSLAQLAYSWLWERGRRRGLLMAGSLLAVLSLAVSLCLIWVDPRGIGEDIGAKTLAISSIWSICILLLGALTLARLRRPWSAVNTLTQAVLILLALVAAVAIVYEADDDEVWRAIGILVVLSVCGAVSVPILHRLTTMRSAEPVTTALALQIVCPRCSKPQLLAAGHSHCAACGLRLYIEIEEEKCPKCGYVLYRLTSDRCPECGTPVSAAATRA